MKPTQQEIDSALEELKISMQESYEADRIEETVKLKKIAAHKRLSLARDSIRSISFS